VIRTSSRVCNYNFCKIVINNWNSSALSGCKLSFSIYLTSYQRTDIASNFLTERRRRWRQRSCAVSVLIISWGGVRARLLRRGEWEWGRRETRAGHLVMECHQLVSGRRVPASAAAAMSSWLVIGASDDRWRQVAVLFARRRRHHSVAVVVFHR